MRVRSFLCVISLMAAWSQHVSAQSQRTCGTDAYYQEQIKVNPQIELDVNQAKLAAQQWLKNNPASKKAVLRTIPIVFHVVYENATENISDAQVLSQLDILNLDYRKLNADTGSVPSAFKSIAADSEIEFCIAVRDPSGNPTTGITRTATTVNSFSSVSPKSNASGGKDPWPRNDYLNFWICDLGGGLLGYATGPGGSSANDGIVCGYQYIGAPPANPFGGSFNQGRTATHEIGHWLGLNHTFNGGCSGFGDGIADTPPTSNSNYGCPGTQNTCSNDNPDMNDMTMNYMDYVDDMCMYIFTEGQKSVMQSVLATTRSSLQNSSGCTALSNLDASIAIVTPTDTICGLSSFAPAVTLINYGSNTLTSVEIAYQIDNEPVQTYNWTGNLTSFDAEEIVLPNVTVAFGDHSLKTYVTNPNSGVDELAANDTSLSNFHFKLGNSVNLTLTLGDFQIANLLAWSLRDAAGNLVDSINGYVKNTTNIESNCLAEGCYTFKMYDVAGNAEGSFSLVDVLGDTLAAVNDLLDFTYTFCVSTTGIIENEVYSSSFQLYPNPTNGIVNIRFASLFSGNAHLKVFSAQGEVCVNEKIQTAGNESIRLNLTGKAAGLYFVQVTNENGTYTQKFSLLQ